MRGDEGGESCGKDVNGVDILEELIDLKVRKLVVIVVS